MRKTGIAIADFNIQFVDQKMKPDLIDALSDHTPIDV